MSRRACILGAVGLVLLLALAVFLNEHAPLNSPANLAASTIDPDNGDTKINWNHYPKYDISLSEQDNLTITSPGVYHLTGKANYPVIVNAGTQSIKLVLDNVTINNSAGPAVACYAAEDLVIELVGENSLSDGTTYDASFNEDVNAVIYSKSDLTFEGDGKLNLTANYQDGIVSKDDLKFASGTYDITAKDDAIRGKDSVYIVNGTFEIAAKEDAIKSTNATTAGKGFILIENGIITIASGDDGIHAETALMINGGTINIDKSYEGIESPRIIINNGVISVYASDDGINAGSSSDNSAASEQASEPSQEIIINGGDVYVNAAGDGIDSNGYINFNGGTVVVDGPMNDGNGALDATLGIVMNGGKVIALGSSGMAESLGETSSINNISIYLAQSQRAGTKVTIKDTSGTTLIEHASAKSFSHIAAGAEEFEFGNTYVLYLNNEEYQTFTIENITTVVGNSNTNANRPGNCSIQAPPDMRN